MLDPATILEAGLKAAESASHVADSLGNLLTNHSADIASDCCSSNNYPEKPPV